MTGYAPSDPRAWTTGKQVSLWLLSQSQRSHKKRWAARYDPARDLWILPTGSLVPRLAGSAEVAEGEDALFEMDDEAVWLDDDWPDTDRAAHCEHCGQHWTGQKVCHCAACHLTFTAVGGFDFHRTRTIPRRCQTSDELRANGYEPNDRNQWRKPAPADLYPRKDSA